MFCLATFQSAHAADEYDIYLLAGQSNMDGRRFVVGLPADQKMSVENPIIFYRNDKRSSSR